MEARSIIRTLIAALVGIGIIVLFIVVIAKAFSGGGGGATKQIDLGLYTDTAQATLLIDAPTNIDQDHREVRITVSGTQSEIDLIQGYQGNVLDSRTYSNNGASFGSFLQALKLASFAKGDSTSTADYRGYCPTGDRYVYTFNDGQKDLFTYWATSCGQGTFGGNRELVRELFERQIPENDFDKLTSDVPLG